MTLTLLIALQSVQVLILWLHDWAPWPPLNDVGAVQAAESKARLVRVTLLSATAAHFDRLNRLSSRPVPA